MRIGQTLSSIANLRLRPVGIIATGDLVDRGKPAEYEELKAILSDLDIPIYLGVGDHDNRLAALSKFAAPEIETDPNGFVQYVREYKD